MTRTSASTCFFRFNLKTEHVDFIHSFACQCHAYYTKYYNATCNAVNTHLFKTALNLLGEIVRKAIKTAARDLVLHGIVSQSNRPSIINGVRFYDCCSNINRRLSRSKKASTNRFLHESLLKIWDFFHECEKFRLFTSGA
jgi:hypothetical protein